MSGGCLHNWSVNPGSTTGECQCGTVIAALTSALERTEANFVRAVKGQPVRDMAETLAENRAALAASDGEQP